MKLIIKLNVLFILEDYRKYNKKHVSSRNNILVGFSGIKKAFGSE